MKRLKKALAVITTAAITAVPFCSMFSASAAVEQYHTYRLYADLEPASSLKNLYLVTVYKRGSVFFDERVKGNVPGELGGSGSATDNWITHVDIFTAPSDLVSGGNLFRWEAYTKLNDKPENILRLSGCDAYNSAEQKISSDFIKVHVVKVGDINQDGAVNWDDVTALNDHLLGQTVLTGNPLRSADTDNDGVVNYTDLTVLINYASGTLGHF